MSDSFIAIFGTGLFTGVALTLIILLLTGGRNERHSYIDADMRIYVPSRNRNRGGDERGDKQVEKITSEELGTILRTMSATLKADQDERQYMNEAADRLEKLDRLEKWMKGQYDT